MEKHKLKFKLFNCFWSTLDWVYPPVCAVCGLPGSPLCIGCRNEIQYIKGRVCLICGASIDQGEIYCEDCKIRKPVFDGVRSLAFYGGVIRECIHALKYKNNRVLGKFFAELLVPIVKGENWSIDLVIPVPLSQERYKERGYNQAASVAHPLALLLELDFQPYGLKQARDTRSQVGLSAEERRLNVVGAFKAVPELVDNKNVLLVDDVMTTGATLESCAKTLKDSGSNKVYCTTIARFSG